MHRSASSSGMRRTSGVARWRRAGRSWPRRKRTTPRPSCRHVPNVHRSVKTSTPHELINVPSIPPTCPTGLQLLASPRVVAAPRLLQTSRTHRGAADGRAPRALIPGLPLREAARRRPHALAHGASMPLPWAMCSQHLMFTHTCVRLGPRHGPARHQRLSHRVDPADARARRRRGGLAAAVPDGQPCRQSQGLLVR